MEADEERRERRKSDRDGKGESFCLIIYSCGCFMVDGCLVGGVGGVCTF